MKMEGKGRTRQNCAFKSRGWKQNNWETKSAEAAEYHTCSVAVLTFPEMLKWIFLSLIPSCLCSGLLSPKVCCVQRPACFSCREAALIAKLPLPLLWRRSWQAGGDPWALQLASLLKGQPERGTSKQARVGLWHVLWVSILPPANLPYCAFVKQVNY